jgi:hypothetical protein
MRTTILMSQNTVNMAFLNLDWVGMISSALIYIKLGIVFTKIQLSSSVITSRKSMYDCDSRTLRSIFALSTRFLRSWSVNIYGTHLKWRHWRPRDLVTCSQTIILGMYRSLLNLRSKENIISSSCFRIVASTSSSGDLPDHGSSLIEIRRILNSWTQWYMETRV